MINPNNYNKLDPNNRLTLTDTKVTFADLTSDEECRVRKSYGTGFFRQGIRHSWVAQVITRGGGNANDGGFACTWTLANVDECYQHLVLDDHDLFVAFLYGGQYVEPEPDEKLYFREIVGGVMMNGDFMFIGLTKHRSVVDWTDDGPFGRLTLKAYDMDGFILGTMFFDLSADNSFDYHFFINSRDVDAAHYILDGLIDEYDLGLAIQGERSVFTLDTERREFALADAQRTMVLYSGRGGLTLDDARREMRLDTERRIFRV